MTKAQWVTACDRIVERFCSGESSLQIAILGLKRLGLSQHEATDLLTGGIA